MKGLMVSPPKSRIGHHDEEGVDLGGQRPAHGLQQAAVGDGLEVLAAVALGVLADAVEDDDGVLHAEAQHGEQGGQEERVHLVAHQNAHQRGKAGRDHHVMHHGHDRADAVAQGMGHVAKSEHDPEHDRSRGEQHGDQGRTGHLLTNGGADVAVLQGLDAAELGAELVLDGSLDLRRDLFEARLEAIARRRPPSSQAVSPKPWSRNTWRISAGCALSPKINSQ